MRIISPIVTTAFAAILAACAGNPAPGDSAYPYNVTGAYDAALETMGVVYSGTARVETARGGTLTGSVEVRSPETASGMVSGFVRGDTLRFDLPYERAGGCTGFLSGVGTITAGGGEVSGELEATDDCVGDTFPGTFRWSRAAATEGEAG